MRKQILFNSGRSFHKPQPNYAKKSLQTKPIIKQQSHLNSLKSMKVKLLNDSRKSNKPPIQLIPYGFFNSHEYPNYKLIKNNDFVSERVCAVNIPRFDDLGSFLQPNYIRPYYFPFSTGHIPRFGDLGSFLQPNYIRPYYFPFSTGRSKKRLSDHIDCYPNKKRLHNDNNCSPNKKRKLNDSTVISLYKE
ncbi:hypothetical protein Catovirus_1_593 [Catovirus CTV1]|uniref:Uncharacterized protein n=1 Tax=Catovirus CTV1 TaxID=1977631 RepID=A0A1V0SA23_9VIRU|nr:hypothetical protein Catovirus_1_593 [Catovirus CTV1]